MLFIALKILCHFLLAYRVCVDKTAHSFIGALLYITDCFSLGTMNILFLPLTFVILIMMCLGVGHFGFMLFGTDKLWICMSIPIIRLRKLSVTIYSNRISILCSLSPPSGTPMM